MHLPVICRGSRLNRYNLFSIATLAALLVIFPLLSFAGVEGKAGRSNFAHVNKHAPSEIPMRLAHIISLDESRPRAKQTLKVLRDMGFETTIVKPKYVGHTRKDQTLSNKFAMIDAVEQIAKGKQPWGYVFEDDIYQHEASNMQLRDFIEAEKNSKNFMYLGVCTAGEAVSFMCGRCAHAMGFSRGGAEEILSFARKFSPTLATGKSPVDEEYFDVIVEGWCASKGGFRVVGPLFPSSRGHVEHYGALIQDRGAFPSEIDAAPL